MPICRKCDKFSNCLTVDPCEHCGAKDWLPTPPVSSDHWERRIFAKLLGIGFVISVIMVVIYWLTPEQEKLADEYHISKQNVVVEPKPHGCDFDDAPLGNKHCHYEKAVDVQRAPCGGSDCKVTEVYVSWRRVEE